MKYSECLVAQLAIVESIDMVRRDLRHAANRHAQKEIHNRLINLYAQLNTCTIANSIVERIRIEA